jgi:hypothetical protein
MPETNRLRQRFSQLEDPRLARRQRHSLHDILIVALDGKTLRRSGGAGQSPVHLVSASAVGNRFVLGQLRTPEKSNELSGAR